MSTQRRDSRGKIGGVYGHVSQGGLGGLGRGGRGGRGGGSQGPSALVEFAVRGLARGIGLLSEAMHARKESKKHKEEGESTLSTISVEDSIPHFSGTSLKDIEGPNEKDAMQHHNTKVGPEDHYSFEEDSEFDRKVDGHISLACPVSNEPNFTADQITDIFLQNKPPPSFTENSVPCRLTLPVVLPQRRPKDRAQGFVRAYAPSLEPCGISQEQWLAFLDTFEKASQASPWIKAINLASIGTMFLSSVASIVISIAIQAATSVATEMHARYNFLDKINDNFFRPRGLFCLIMTWNSESAEQTETVNLSTMITSSIDSGNTGIQNKFKTSSGKTYGEVEFLEMAPLIFPTLDKKEDQSSGEATSSRNQMKNTKSFVSEYWDKRAVAKYAAKHPESVLAKSVPKVNFYSIYADPSHPASSGNLVSLITGGHINPNPLQPGGGLVSSFAGVFGNGNSQRSYGEEERMSDGARITFHCNTGTGGCVQEDCYSQQHHINSSGVATQEKLGGRQSISGGHGGGTGPLGLPSFGGMSPVKKLLKKNVLYLMVVNMPSEGEIAAAMPKEKQT